MSVVDKYMGASENASPDTSIGHHVSSSPAYNGTEERDSGDDLSASHPSASANRRLNQHSLDYTHEGSGSDHHHANDDDEHSDHGDEDHEDQDEDDDNDSDASSECAGKKPGVLHRLRHKDPFAKLEKEWKKEQRNIVKREAAVRKELYAGEKKLRPKQSFIMKVLSRKKDKQEDDLETTSSSRFSLRKKSASKAHHDSELGTEADVESVDAEALARKGSRLSFWKKKQSS
jgi:hypothetical protein